MTASDPDTPNWCKETAGPITNITVKMMLGMKFIELFRCLNLRRRASMTRPPAPAITLDVLVGGCGGVTVRFSRGCRPAKELIQFRERFVSTASCQASGTAPPRRRQNGVGWTSRPYLRWAFHKVRHVRRAFHKVRHAARSVVRREVKGASAKQQACERDWQ
jgi:hypothetical protein